MRIYHERDLRKGRVSAQGQTYAICKNVYENQKLLIPDPMHYSKDSARAEIVVESLRWLHEQGRIACDAYTIMPEHIHIILTLLEEWTLSSVTKSLFNYTARMLNRMCNRTGRFWHKTYYDRRIRSEDELEKQMNYIWMNPVRAGYVDCPEEWPFTAILPDWQTAPIMRTLTTLPPSSTANIL